MPQAASAGGARATKVPQFQAMSKFSCARKAPSVIFLRKCHLPLGGRLTLLSPKIGNK